MLFRSRAIDPTLDLGLILNRFYIFAVCVICKSRAVAITQEFKQLITASAMHFYPTLHRLTVMDPTSANLEDIRKCYNKTIPGWVDFTNLPSCHTTIMVNALLRRDWGCRPVWCSDDRPSNREHTRFARDISELALAEYQRKQEVPKWIVDFAFNSLSLDPLPSASIVANCFEIIAIHLGYDIPDAIALGGR